MKHDTNKQDYGLQLTEEQLVSWRLLLAMAVDKEFTDEQLHKFRDAFQKVLDEIGE